MIATLSLDLDCSLFRAAVEALTDRPEALDDASIKAGVQAYHDIERAARTGEGVTRG